MAKDTRTTMTIKLVPGVDDDLIAWWSDIPKGDKEPDKSRNARAKKLLRRFLDGAPSLEQIESELEAERQAREASEERFSESLEVQEALRRQVEAEQIAQVALQKQVEAEQAARDAIYQQVETVRCINEALQERIKLEMIVKDAINQELESTRRQAIELRSEIDQVRADASDAYDQQGVKIQELQLALSKLPIITRKVMEDFSHQITPATIDESQLLDIQAQLDALMSRIEEVAQMRGGTPKETKKRTLSKDDLAERERRLQKTNW